MQCWYNYFEVVGLLFHFFNVFLFVYNHISIIINGDPSQFSGSDIVANRTSNYIFFNLFPADSFDFKKKMKFLYIANFMQITTGHQK